MKTLSFVIPVYNEAKRIQKAFSALEELQLPRGLQLEQIIFVNDGSTDRTVSRIKYFVSSMKKGKILNTKYQIQIIDYQPNRGKGFAVKQGMLASRADYTLFFDADMSTPLSEIKKFMPKMNAGIDVILGTRKNGKSTVVLHQPRYRELLGKGYTYLTQFILQTDTTDFTCGFKAFSRMAKNEIFNRSRIKRWSYDAEIVYLAEKLEYSIVEVPVTWADDRGSRVRIFKAIFTSLSELISIRLNDIAGWYTPNLIYTPSLTK